ncbi:Aste57867_5808 [Aphanomyces stellatus]|uniref:Aste57867_5808 protein n=1 Tax=Aphanomyces stellatus TaxID=120398 RepID=A0A485KH79_9STRA|nr:hypothetical protein As57867_005794 [Aphanomyces stellatus]VFT82831.1 Aste57867_5808 [Aphanomyces stellatus]
MSLLRLVVVFAALSLPHVYGLPQHLYVTNARGKLFVQTRSGDSWSGWGCPYGFGIQALAATVSKTTSSNELFVVGADGFIYRFHEDPRSSTWRDWQLLPGVTNPIQLTSSHTTAGDWSVYAVDANHSLWAMSGALPTWTFLGSGIQTVAPSSDANGNEGFIAILSGGWVVASGTSVDSGGVWAPWMSIGSANIQSLDQLAIATAATGLRCIFAVGPSSSVLALLETQVNSWSPTWSVLPTINADHPNRCLRDG